MLFGGTAHLDERLNTLNTSHSGYYCLVLLSMHIPIQHSGDVTSQKFLWGFLSWLRLFLFTSTKPQARQINRARTVACYSLVSNVLWKVAAFPHGRYMERYFNNKDICLVPFVFVVMQLSIFWTNLKLLWIFVGIHLQTELRQKSWESEPEHIAQVLQVDSLSITFVPASPRP